MTQNGHLIRLSCKIKVIYHFYMCTLLVLFFTGKAKYLFRSNIKSLKSHNNYSSPTFRMLLHTLKILQCVFPTYRRMLL
jgi:hypothetical protein